RFFGQGYFKIGYDSKKLWLPSPFYSLGLGEKHPSIYRMWLGQEHEYLSPNGSLSPSHFMDNHAGFVMNRKNFMASFEFLTRTENNAYDIARIDDSTFTYVNIYEIYSQGAMASLFLNLPKGLGNLLSLSVNDMRWDKGRGVRERFPVYILSHVMRYYKPFMQKRFQGELVLKSSYVSNIYDFSFKAGERKERQGFYLLDLRIGFKIRDFRMFYSVDNLYNEVVEWNEGSFLPGFNIHWGLSWMIFESQSKNTSQK
ncbi:MAG: hypothetical protein AB1633_13095, partial [Elusimicrobiota bacterium]